MTCTCPHCGAEVPVPIECEWGGELTCPECSLTCVVTYEEYYDDETGEEWGYTYLEKP